MNDFSDVLSGIFIGIMIGGLLATLSLCYQIFEKAQKEEVENKLIYTYRWEVFKK